MIAKLRSALEKHLQKVTDFDPFKKWDDINTMEDFLLKLQNDPAFYPFFLNNEMYLKARISGNLITSLHKKLGDLYEEMFHIILEHKLSVPPGDLKFKVTIKIDDKDQERSTDGLIRFDNYSGCTKAKLVKLTKNPNVQGIVFEVRSCYQIGDSKRIQADENMAFALKLLKYEPIMLIFCNTSLESPVARLKKSWNLFEGKKSFDFVTKLSGFNLLNFLKQEKELIRKHIDKIFLMFN
ncbi:MAG: hypothetical protein NTW26_03910 [bacterium]|nr:hypothetical protein [bacterium]